MENYASNSHKSKQMAAAKKEKVTSGKVTVKKKPQKKLKDIFIKGDLNEVKDYAFNDILVPAVIKAVTDIVKNGIDIFFYGEARSRGGGSGRTDYRGAYVQSSGRNYHRTRSTVGNDFEMPVFEDRADAERVLEAIVSDSMQNKIVTVYDVFDYAGVSVDHEYTLQKYGWTNLRDADIIRTDGGFEIRLPKPMAIDY